MSPAEFGSAKMPGTPPLGEQEIDPTGESQRLANKIAQGRKEAFELEWSKGEPLPPPDFLAQAPYQPATIKVPKAEDIT